MVLSCSHSFTALTTLQAQTRGYAAIVAYRSFGQTWKFIWLFLLFHFFFILDRFDFSFLGHYHEAVEEETSQHQGTISF